MKNRIILVLLFTISTSLFCQIDVNLVHLDTNDTVAFNDIHSKFGLDQDKPTLIITWSGKWCFPCRKLIDRYMDCDLSYLNLITINVDREDDRDEVLNQGFHNNWNNSHNFHANLGGDSNGLDNVFNVSSAPLILYMLDGRIQDALTSFEIYPHKLYMTKRVNDIKFIWGSSNDLNSVAWNTYVNSDDQEVLEESINIVKRSIELNTNYSNLDTLAALLFKTGKYTEALKKAKEAIEKAKEDDEDYSTTSDLINKIIEKL